MDREILFRAKDGCSGEWVVGYYAIVGGTHSIIASEKNILSVYGSRNGYPTFRIQPDTLGELTGFGDMKGVRIWEGDIIEAHYDDEEPELKTRYEVLFRNGQWQIRQIQAKTDCYDTLDDFTCMRSKVVGNIYDNPGLLEGGAR